MNPLDQYPQARKALYVVQWVVNGILTVAGAVFLINGTDMNDLPQWYLLTAGIAPVLWTYLGITAQTNVNPPVDTAPTPTPLPPSEPI